MNSLELIQTVAIIVGLGLTAWTIRISVRQRDATVYQNIISSMQQINQVLVENPELIPYFADRLSLPENPELRAKILEMSAMHLDLMDNVQSQAPSMPQYPWESWAFYFKDMFDSSPALKEYLSSHKDWYPKLSTWLKTADKKGIMKNFLIHGKKRRRIQD